MPVNRNPARIFSGSSVKIPAEIDAPLVVVVIVEVNKFAGNVRAVNILYHISSLVLPGLGQFIFPKRKPVPDLVSESQKIHIAKRNYAIRIGRIVSKRTGDTKDILGYYRNIYAVGSRGFFIHPNA